MKKHRPNIAKIANSVNTEEDIGVASDSSSSCSSSSSSSSESSSESETDSDSGSEGHDEEKEKEKHGNRAKRYSKFCEFTDFSHSLI